MFQRTPSSVASGCKSERSPTRRSGPCAPTQACSSFVTMGASMKGACRGSCSGKLGTGTPPNERKRRHFHNKLTLSTLIDWHPNNLEIALLGRLNTLRTKPQRFIPVLERRLKKMKDSHRDEEETFKNLIEFLRKQKPVSRLRMSFVLSKGPKKLKTCFNQCAKMQCDNVCAIETKDPFPDYTNEYHSWNRMHVSTRLTAMLVRHGRCADIMDFGGKSATDILARLLTIGSQETCELHRKVIFYPEFDFVGIAECMHHKTGKICCLTFACRRPAHERLESKFSHYSSGGGGSRGLTSYYVNGKRRSARHNDGDAESRTAEEKLGGSGIMIDHHRRHLHHHHHHHTNKYQHQHQNISHHHHHQQQQQSNFVVAPPGTPEQHPLNIVLVPPSTPNDVVSLPLSGAITGDGGGGGGEDFAEIRDVIAKARNTIPPPGKQDTLLAAEDKEGGLADSADDGSSVGAVAAAIPEVVATPDRVGTPEAALAENIDSPSSWGRREEG